MPQRYCLNVKLWFKTDRVQDFLAVILADKKQTEALEPTCKRFTFGKSITEENCYLLQEEYDDKAAFESHCKTEHFAQWIEFTNSYPFTKPPQVDIFEEADCDKLAAEAEAERVRKAERLAELERITSTTVGKEYYVFNRYLRESVSESERIRQQEEVNRLAAEAEAESIRLEKEAHK